MQFQPADMVMLDLGNHIYKLGCSAIEVAKGQQFLGQNLLETDYLSNWTS